jgi:hypothetical protein
MDRAVAGEDRERHARRQHRYEGADDRGVRGDAELQYQLHTDHRAENAQHDPAPGLATVLVAAELGADLLVRLSLGLSVAARSQ